MPPSDDSAGDNYSFQIPKRQRDGRVGQTVQHIHRSLLNASKSPLKRKRDAAAAAATAAAAAAAAAEEGIQVSGGTRMMSGPALPTAAELMEAMTAAPALPVDGVSSDSDSDSDDDEIGPGPVPSTSSATTGVPLGADYKQAAVAFGNPRSDSTEAGPVEGGREEWMMSMGESKSLVEALGGGEGGRGEQKSRKFESGKQAKKDAAKVRHVSCCRFTN